MALGGIGGLTAVFVWWSALLVIGLAALPLARAVLPGLPDRGMAFARPLGLLMVGWIWWIGASAGILPTDATGAALAVLLLVAAGIAVAFKDWDVLVGDLMARWRLLLGLELLFGMVFAIWCLYRAFNPAIETAGGEKYMEMAFLSGILESPRFPPNDPWMSGHSISYYYFAYVITALLVHLTGVSRFVAFNLQVPMTLAMTLVGAFGIGWNLVALDGGKRVFPRVVGGALSGLWLAVIGNLSGALEVAYRAGWIPRSSAMWLEVRNLSAGAGACGHDDATWGIVRDLRASGAPVGLTDYLPNRFMWWWRGSRIIHDDCSEIIHEFPFFSFMLADAHPHVMALPYAILALAMGMALLSGSSRAYPPPRLWSGPWLALPLATGALAFLNTWDWPTYTAAVLTAYALWCLGRTGFARDVAMDEADSRGAARFKEHYPLLVAVILAVAWTAWRWTSERMTPAAAAAGAAQGEGILAFLPEGGRAGAGVAAAIAVAAGVVVAVEAVRLARARSWLGRAAIRVGSFGVWLGIIGYFAYLPFHAGFASQVRGIGIATHSSRLSQWLIHMGPPIWLAISLMVAAVFALRNRTALLLACTVSATALAVPLLGAAAGPVVGAVFLAIAVAVQAFGAQRIADSALSRPTSLWLASVFPIVTAVLYAHAAVSWDASGGEALGTWRPLTPGLLAVGAVVAWAVLLESWFGEVRPARGGHGSRAAMSFALLCTALGLSLALVPEIVYVRDLFDNRMNSVFKFLFQAWVLLALGGGFAVRAVWRTAQRPAAVAWSVGTALLLLLSGIYTIGAIRTRTEGVRLELLRSQGVGPWVDSLTLDGLAWWKDQHPADLAAAGWLKANARGTPTILEAGGGSYTHAGRMALATGFPTVLGPDWHEQQWRGTREEIDPRKAEVERFYNGMSRAQMDAFLDRYDVQFVVVGSLERATYNPPAVFESQLETLLEPVYEYETLRLFARPDYDRARRVAPGGRDGG